MRFILVLTTLFIGALLPVQAVFNSKLGRQTGGPLVSSFLSFFVGLLVLLIINLAVNSSALFQIKPSSVTPWYVWMGGLLGAIFVTCVIFVSQRQGVALTFALVVTGQIIISLLIDHFGLFGSSVHPINFQKILGAALIVAGLVFIKK